MFSNNIQLFSNVIVSRLIDAAFALLVGLTISEALSVFNKISEKIDVLKDRPIKGYIQILKIIISAFVVIIIFAIVTGQSVAYYISGLGALTAVLLLVFQDTILSFVASVQIGQNDIIKIGDWIEVPEFEKLPSTSRTPLKKLLEPDCMSKFPSILSVVP